MATTAATIMQKVLKIDKHCKEQVNFHFGLGKSFSGWKSFKTWEKYLPLEFGIGNWNLELTVPQQNVTKIFDSRNELITFL